MNQNNFGIFPKCNTRNILCEDSPLIVWKKKICLTYWKSNPRPLPLYNPRETEIFMMKPWDVVLQMQMYMFIVQISPPIQQTTIHTPSIGTHTISFLWRMQRIFCTYSQSLQVSFYCSTRNPLLLGEQRQHGMRSLPDTSTHDQ